MDRNAAATCQSIWTVILHGLVTTIKTAPPITIAQAHTISAGCFYLAALKSIGSVYAGLLSSVEPVAATVLAALFLGTTFQAIDVVGFVLVLSTMFILNYKNT